MSHLKREGFGKFQREADDTITTQKMQKKVRAGRGLACCGGRRRQPARESTSPFQPHDGSGISPEGLRGFCGADAFRAPDVQQLVFVSMGFAESPGLPPAAGVKGCGVFRARAGTVVRRRRVSSSRPPCLLLRVVAGSSSAASELQGLFRKHFNQGNARKLSCPLPLFTCRASALRGSHAEDTKRGRTPTWCGKCTAVPFS